MNIINELIIILLMFFILVNVFILFKIFKFKKLEKKVELEIGKRIEKDRIQYKNNEENKRENKEKKFEKLIKDYVEKVKLNYNFITEIIYPNHQIKIILHKSKKEVRLDIYIFRYKE